MRADGHGITDWREIAVPIRRIRLYGVAKEVDDIGKLIRCAGRWIVIGVVVRASSAAVVAAAAACGKVEQRSKCENRYGSHDRPPQRPASERNSFAAHDDSLLSMTDPTVSASAERPPV